MNTSLSRIYNPLGLVSAAALTFCSLVAGLATPALAQLGSISGTKFNDLNQNGIREPLELGLPGWQIQLINFDGDVIATTTTNLFGNYEFTGLAPGPYVVREVMQPGWKQTLPNFIESMQLGQVNGGWDYDDPDNDWPLIAPDANGNFQSPINITETPPIDLSEYITINYSGQNLDEVKNSGYNFDVEYFPSNFNTVDVAGETFELLQFHFHYESEHAIDGLLSDMELHFVNRHEDGGLSVLGLLVEEGSENLPLKPLFDAIDAQLDANGSLPSTFTLPQNLNIASIFPNNFDGWFYNGSLTTPPATEGVNWFVFETPIQLSTAQIDIFQNFLSSIGFTHNNRPLQDLNGRQLNEHTHQETLNGGSISQLNFGNALDLGLFRFAQLNYQVTVNENDVVDLNFGSTNTTIPEPSSVIALFGLSGVGLLSRLRQKKVER
ncbi:Carbonate dehydratase [Rippkaea orientalis PCC 8801]|uniref:carbonic anhydrase n=1 Tax=Rippkaea orientalis (strain PCC 8801 / RF-1) TaxID=41431 RepID=B7JZV8_RIPO1|nr:carbonic anhydrase family protein [Rippkaea orientalis]ACK65051.1 Carbonate dehydratase [Rippkaea orientalis PCC 8801]